MLSCLKAKDKMVSHYHFLNYFNPLNYITLTYPHNSMYLSVWMKKLLFVLKLQFQMSSPNSLPFPVYHLQLKCMDMSNSLKQVSLESKRVPTSYFPYIRQFYVFCSRIWILAQVNEDVCMDKQ